MRLGDKFDEAAPSPAGAALTLEAGPHGPWLAAAGSPLSPFNAHRPLAAAPASTKPHGTPGQGEQQAPL